MSKYMTYTMRIGWEGKQNSSIFTLDTSTIGGTAGFGWEFNPGFEGPYDDVTGRCKKVVLTKGRDDDLGNIVSGRLEVDLHDDAAALYNPRNTLSPLYGQIRPLRPCFFSLTAGGQVYDTFRGWLDDAESDYDYGHNNAHFMFRDMFIWLERVKPIISATGVTTVGAAIGKILDAVGWLDPNFRTLDIGSTIPNFQADGTITALQLIDSLLEADRGVFYVTRRGKARYRDRHYKETQKVSSYTLSSASVVVPGVSLSRLQNSQTVTRTGGVAQKVVDQASINEFQESAAPDVASDYIMNDVDAKDLAGYIVLRRSQPTDAVWSGNVLEGTLGEAQSLGNMDLFDRITLSTIVDPQDYFIEKEVITAEAGKLHSINLVLSTPLTYNALVLDTTTFDNGQMVY